MFKSVVIQQAMPILCKDSANRIQSKLVCFVEVPPILCKNRASRKQRKLVYFIEVQPILCKGNKKRLIATRNHILLSYIEAATCCNKTSLHRKINHRQTGRHMEIRKFFIGQFDTTKPPHWRITIQRHTFWTS